MIDMGISFHCPYEKRMDKIGAGIIQCDVDGHICLNQQYCPSKRIYEITAAVGRCEKRKRGKPEITEDGRDTADAK